jgi:putative phosphoesterase
MSKSDMTVHCGDFTKMDVVDGVLSVANHAIVVHGNSDPIEIRKALPATEMIDTGDLKIGVTHPVWGGPPFELEKLLGDFDVPVDVVLFGHLHEVHNVRKNGVLFINPGQGYRSFMMDSTIVEITVDGLSVHAEIKVIESAEEKKKLNRRYLYDS